MSNEEPMIQVVFPQFTRPANWPKPGSAPETREQWDALREMDEIALREMGLGKWGTVPEDAPDARMLMLFPGYWYDDIPEGFMVTGFNGNDEEFVPGVTDDDIRFGCLAYGVLAAENSNG